MNESIIIGFSTHKNFNLLSWIIQKIDHTSFSHVYVKWHADSVSRDLIYQASGLLVNFCNTEIFDSENVSIAEYSIPITPEEKLQIIQTAIDLVGKPYGMKELIGIGVVRFMGLFGKKIKNPFPSGSSTYICSKLVATLLLKLGFKIEDLDAVAPKDIYDLLRGKYGPPLSS